MDKTNILSSELLSLVDFKNGVFFTLLPGDADKHLLYDFKTYGILPQYPEEVYFVDGKKSTYSFIPSIKNELSDLISAEMIADDQVSCVFDKVTGSRNNNYYIYYADVHPMFYKDEVYFHLDKQHASYELIKNV